MKRVLVCILMPLLIASTSYGFDPEEVADQLRAIKTELTEQGVTHGLEFTGPVHEAEFWRLAIVERGLEDRPELACLEYANSWFDRAQTIEPIPITDDFDEEDMIGFIRSVPTLYFAFSADPELFSRIVEAQFGNTTEEPICPAIADLACHGAKDLDELAWQRLFNSGVKLSDPEQKMTAIERSHSLEALKEIIHHLEVQSPDKQDHITLSSKSGTIDSKLKGFIRESVRLSAAQVDFILKELRIGAVDREGNHQEANIDLALCLKAALESYVSGKLASREVFEVILKHFCGEETKIPLGEIQQVGSAGMTQRGLTFEFLFNVTPDNLADYKAILSEFFDFGFEQLAKTISIHGEQRSLFANDFMATYMRPFGSPENRPSQNQRTAQRELLEFFLRNLTVEQRREIFIPGGIKVQNLALSCMTTDDPGAWADLKGVLENLLKVKFFTQVVPVPAK